MAAWHGHVHHLESGGEHNSDNDTAIAGAVDTTGVRPGLQLNMRHLDPRRALHTLVFGRNVAGIKWCGPDCYLWRNTGTGT